MQEKGSFADIVIQFDVVKNKVAIMEYYIQAMEKAGIQVIKGDDMPYGTYVLGLSLQVCLQLADTMPFKRPLCKDVTSHFASGERIAMLWHVLSSLRASAVPVPTPLYKDGSLLHEGMQLKIITEMWPLHNHGELSHLMESWVKGRGFFTQPLDQVRTYYGDQVRSR